MCSVVRHLYKHDNMCPVLQGSTLCPLHIPSLSNNCKQLTQLDTFAECGDARLYVAMQLSCCARQQGWFNLLVNYTVPHADTCPAHT